MPSNLEWILIVIGLMVCAGLATLIVRQSRELRNTRRERRVVSAVEAERRDSMLTSLRVLAMSIEQDQVEASEACIRIKRLLDHIEPGLLAQPPFTVFEEMYEATRHMPTHQTRMDTDPRFVQKLDRQRHALERQHRDRILEAAHALRQHVEGIEESGAA